MRLQLLTCVAFLTLTSLAAFADESNLLPNGSFEFWSHHGIERLPDTIKNDPAFEGADPLIPTRWTWCVNKPMRLKQSADAHSGKHSLAVSSAQGGGGYIQMGKFEVVPGAKYSYGAWAKGSGQLTVELFGEAPEGWQQLGVVTGKPNAAWSNIGANIEIPRHIRLVWLRISMAAPCEMVLDDAHISAAMDKPYDADAVLNKKCDRDENTLLLLDFDKDDPDLKLEGKMKVADGGRFGRGLRLDGAKLPGQVATKPFKLPAMPAEGTLEFWFSPDEMPMMADWRRANLYLQVRGPSNELFTVMAGSDTTVSMSYRIDGDTYGKTNYIQTDGAVTAMRMRKGEWHHVAVSWDKSAWRMYFDGVLSGMTTKLPLKWWDAPVAITIGSEYQHLTWNGWMDEVRVSKVKRYGPLLPQGATPVPLPVPEDPVPVGEKPAEKPKVDYTEARSKLITTIEPTQPGAHETVPDAQGGYVYEATSAKPLVEGLDFKLEKDTPVKGLSTAVVQRPRLIGLPNVGGMYWRLGAIKPGRYWVGVLYQTGEGAGKPEAASAGEITDFFLNGRRLNVTTLGDPVQVAPGYWFAEAQSAAAENLKANDEIEVVGNYGSRVRAARMVLHTTEPRRGAHRMRINPGQNAFNEEPSLGLSAETSFLPAKGKEIGSCMADSYYGPEQWIDSTDDLLRGPDGKPQAQCLLFNPLPVPIEVDYECVVKGYQMQVAGRDAAKLTLAPHACVTRPVPFDVTTDDTSYGMTATIKALKNPDLGWPAYDELSFFPGLRHMVPWMDPFSYNFHRRLGVKQVMNSPRPRLALHGAWEAAFTRDLKPVVPPPADLKFDPVTVPPQWGRFANYTDPKSNAMYVRRKFTLTADQAKQVARIVVDSVSSEGTLYVNGRQVGNVRGYGTPLVADATGAVREGENQVLLVVRNKLAITNPQYVNADNPTESTQYMDAPGDCNASLSMGGGFCATGGGVWLELMPQVWARDVKVDTSFRKGSVAARFCVVNASGQEAKLKVKASVEDARNPVLSLGDQELTLKAGESKDMDFTKEWKDARLWDWRQPNLYVMAVEIVDAQSGKRLDLARERFGFRETWVDHDKVFFNGRAVRFNSIGTAPSISVRAAITLGRGSLCTDFNDETGAPITCLVTGLVNTPSKYNIASDAFWKTTEGNAQEAIRRAWNHPCIIAWDLSNEWYTYAPYTGADMTLAGKRFIGLSHVAETLDPSRWTFFNGDHDIGGLHYVLSTHYMLEGAGRDPRAGFEFDGHSSFFPDGAFLKPFDKELKPGDELAVNIHGPAPYKVGSKILADTENQWKVAGYQPPGSCKFMDEENVLSPSLEASAGPVMWMWKQNFDGHRDLNMAIHSNHEETVGTITRGQLLQTFIMPDTAHHGFAGRKFVRNYSILNDLFRPAEMSFKWRLVGPDGNKVLDGTDEQKMESGTTHRAVLSLTLPAVAARTKYTLELRLYSEGQFACGEDRDIDVWPDTPPAVGEAARKVVLFDPKGNTAKLLQTAGVKFETSPSVTPPAGEPSACVFIIGEGALNEDAAKPANNSSESMAGKQAAGLAPFVDKGGRVLVLAQSVLLQGLPVKTGLEPREWVSQPYVRMASHPLLKSVTSWDLHFWAPDRVSARGAYSKPENGAAIALVDSGAEAGLEYVQVMELYRGKGSYLLCQLPLVANYDQEPMAREMMARSLTYVCGAEAFLSPTKRLRLIGPKDGPAGKKMQELGVDFEPVAPDADLDANRPTLVEAGGIPPAAQQAAWKTSLAKGATLVILGARPDDASWLSELTGAPVHITIPPYRMWEGRAYRSVLDPLTAGLSHLDLYWKQYVWNSDPVESPDVLIEPLQDWSVAAQGGRELVFPGALVEFKTGSGRIIVDQRRWMSRHDRLTKQTGRNLSALAIGLGVSITPPPPPREWSQNLAYRTIDLTPYANRSLVDDVAEDGKGGWSDQGPDADLRSFPTGDRTFRGVPFKIGAGAKSIIVLKSSAKPPKSDTPEEVTIPIGYPAEGLCFLHSAAYTGGQVALYQIQYADGSTEEIRLRNGENIRDWASKSGGEFIYERGTKSYVAWTGSCKMFSPISVLLMQWVNPRPDVPIKALRFAIADGDAVPILMGLTAGVKRDAKEAAQNLLKAQDLLKQAQQASDANKPADAKALLQKAIALSPDFTAAHQMLADLCEKAGNEDETLEAYRQWTASNPRTPLPWNRLGQMLEKRKDYKGALEAYTRSLKVEWNQPPAIDAKTRMEAKLRE
jgi:Tfp pilus assembly protein PilF